MAQVGTVDRFSGTLDTLARIGRDESKIAMEKQAKADFTAGAIAITQGKALDDIEKEQPWYNKVFGPSATMRGAEAQTAIGAINQYFADEAAFLDTDEGRSLDPNAYRKRQTASLKGMLTGNSRVDSMITADVTPKMGALSETHMKAHRAYVNEQNVLALSNRILGEAGNVQELANSHGWSHDLTGEAKAVLGQSLSNPPPGMDAASWRKMLVESVVVNYSQGSEVMHRAAKEMGLEFTPQEQLRIIQAQDAYQRSAQGGFSLEAMMAQGAIAAGVDEKITGTADLTRQLDAYQAKYGNLKNDFVRSLYRKAFANSMEQQASYNDARLILSGNGGSITSDTGNIDAARAQAAWDAAYSLIDEKYDQSTPEGRQAAQRDKIEVWAGNGALQDNALKSSMLYMGNPGVIDGKADPRYVAMFEKWSKYAERNEVKALDLLPGDEAKAQAETMRSLLKEGAVDSVESAILMTRTMRDRPVDQAYLSSKDFNDDLENHVNDISASKWSWLGFQDPQQASDNQPAISAYLRGKAKELVQRNYPVKVAVEVAAKTFARNYDIINGIPVANRGQPLASRMGLQPGARPEDAINFHMENGFGLSPGDFRVHDIIDDQVIVNVLDPDNPDYSEQYVPLSLKHLGDTYNVRVVLPPIEAAVANEVRAAVEKHSDEVADLRRRKQALGITTGLDNATLTKEIEENMQRTQKSRQAAAAYIQGTGEALQKGLMMSPVGDVLKFFSGE